MNTSQQIRAHVFITGRVQGVGYRFHTGYQAHQQGITGWVRNRIDGSVEAVFEGELSAVEAMIQWCHQGPETALVEEVTVEYEPPEGLHKFETLRTV